MSRSAIRCTVIVPTYERPEPLARCLAALARLDYPRDAYDVIVVDDGSRVPVESVAAPFRDAFELQVLRQFNAGPSAARSLALTRAQGELVAFTDDDCEPHPKWIREIAKAWIANPGALIGGRTVDGTSNNPWAGVSQAIADTAYDYFARRRPDLRFFASNNLAASGAALRAVGGFDPSFRWAEDRDLCHRWWLAGGDLIEAPAAVVVHKPALDALGFVRQHFGYGRGAWSYLRARAARAGGGVGFEPRFHLEVVRRAARSKSGLGKLACLARLWLWQIANTAGFAAEALSTRPRRARRADPQLALQPRDLDAA